MRVTVKVKINVASIQAKIEAANKEAIAIVSEQVLMDSNQYVPEDQRDLLNSSLSHSNIGEGRLIWSTPYARYQYYGLVMVGRAPKRLTNIPLKYTKSGATKMWCHHARAKHGKDWRKVYENGLRRAMKNGR